MAKKTIVYIDGFNLYYGCVKGTADRWLNLQLFFERLRQDDDIIKVKYFTALVDGPGKSRQADYIRALETQTKMEIILGRFKNKTLQCRVSECTLGGRRSYSAKEEKRTDVSIAISIVSDAYEDLADRFVVVSGDSDLVPPVHLVKTKFPKKEMVVYIPSRSANRGAATELRSAADKSRTLPLDLLKKCQFPASIPDSFGNVIKKPEGW